MQLVVEGLGSAGNATWSSFLRLLSSLPELIGCRQHLSEARDDQRIIGAMKVRCEVAA